MVISHNARSKLMCNGLLRNVCFAAQDTTISEEAEDKGVDKAPIKEIPKVAGQKVQETEKKFYVRETEERKKAICVLSSGRPTGSQTALDGSDR